jgi:hypothetical protein
MGFHMNEVMTGYHQFEPDFGEPGHRAMEFRVRWGTKEMLRWLNPTGDGFMVSELEGTVTIDGLCDAAPCVGSLALRYFSDQTLRYTFDFEAGGAPYHFVGEKVWLRPWNLPWSHTTCFGRVTRKDDGVLVSTSVTRFRFRTAPAFLLSFRPV